MKHYQTTIFGSICHNSCIQMKVVNFEQISVSNHLWCVANRCQKLWFPQLISNISDSMDVTITCRQCTQFNILWKVHSLRLAMGLRQFGDESTGIGSQMRFVVFSRGFVTDPYGFVSQFCLYFR